MDKRGILFEVEKELNSILFQGEILVDIEDIYKIDDASKGDIKKKVAILCFPKKL